MSEPKAVIRTVDNAAFFSSVKVLLDEGRDVEFTVLGNSMYPLLRSKRDSVIIEKADPADLKLRDIILFTPRTDFYLLHRIIRLDEEGFTTAGDGNLFVDGTFRPAALTARVKAIVRNGKTIPVNSLRCRVYASVWVRLFRIRKPLLRLCHHIDGLKYRLKKLFRK